IVAAVAAERVGANGSGAVGRVVRGGTASRARGPVDRDRVRKLTRCLRLGRRGRQMHGPGVLTWAALVRGGQFGRARRLVGEQPAGGLRRIDRHGPVGGLPGAGWHGRRHRRIGLALVVLALVVLALVVLALVGLALLGLALLGLGLLGL